MPRRESGGRGRRDQHKGRHGCCERARQRSEINFPDARPSPRGPVHVRTFPRKDIMGSFPKASTLERQHRGQERSGRRGLSDELHTTTTSRGRSRRGESPTCSPQATRSKDRSSDSGTLTGMLETRCVRRARIRGRVSNTGRPSRSRSTATLWVFPVPHGMARGPLHGLDKGARDS